MAPALTVALTAICFLRIARILQISDSLTNENLLHVDHDNVFSICYMVIFNHYRNVNVPMMRILKNSDESFCMVQQFPLWNTNGDNYRTALQVYHESNNA